MGHHRPAKRVLYLCIGVTFLAIFAQVTLAHSRQNFRRPAMWLPVVGAPAVGVIALLLAAFDLPVLGVLLAAGAGASALTGLVGSYFHISGVGKRVGGYTLSNFMTGPPPALPFVITAVSAVTLYVLYAL